MPDVPVTAIVEVVKLLVRAVLEFKRASNMSDEEFQKAWDATLAEFNENDPANLPDV